MSKQKKPDSRVPSVLREAPLSRAIPAVDGPAYGFKGPEGFHSMDEVTVVGVRKDLFQRLESVNGGKYAEKVFAAVNLVMVSKLERDFPGCVASAFMMTRKGDIAVKVDGAADGGIATDREFLQGRLDDASAKVAECLGV